MSRQQLVLAFTLLACGTFILCATAADPKKPSKPSRDSVLKSDPSDGAKSKKADGKSGETAKAGSEEDLGPWEVTDRVELIYKDKLSISGDKTLTAKVQVKNKSDGDLAGKLVLVIDGSTIPGTKLAQPSGQFTEATPYILITPAKRKLESGDESSVKTLILNSEASLAEMEDDDKKDPELRWRVFTTTRPDGFETEPPADDKKVPGKSYTWGEMRQVMAIQEKHTESLFAQFPKEIVGTATTENSDGKPVMLVYTNRGGMSRKLPGTIDGVDVEVVVSGNFRAGPSRSAVTHDDGKAQLVPKPDPEPEVTAEKARASAQATATPRLAQAGPPTKRFTRPVPIGVSSINQTLSICATGTLGCRCIGFDGSLYALSNNHVFANENAAAIGSALCQPGPLDNGCSTSAADVVGTLYDYEKIAYVGTTTTVKYNLMDAAIGKTSATQVDYQTWTPGYGTPSRYPQEAVYLGLLVQKCGRTTGYTKGKITALNVNSIVAYEPGDALFRGNIAVETQLRYPAFGGPGDSGSLVVTQADRRPVGLLYAGGSVTTLLCPISPILNRFRVGVDDGTGSTPVMGSGRMGVAVGPPKK